MEKVNNKQMNSQRMIKEAIRKIALGRSIERIDMSPTGMSGIGTARMIHGYVAKIHNNPDDDEFDVYAGTIDVGEYPDETASSEPLIHKGVLLSGTKDNQGGFLVIPTLFSDVTVVSDSATQYMYIVNYSHADVIQLSVHKEITIGVTETEELDSQDENTPDYDELEPTGKESSTKYSASSVETIVKDENDKQTTQKITPEQIEFVTDQSVIRQSADKIEQRVGDCAITTTKKKITLGAEDATEPLVLGNELAKLMLDFLTECSKIMTPTMMGTMPAVNAASFSSLISKIEKFLSKTTFTQ